MSHPIGYTFGCHSATWSCTILAFLSILVATSVRDRIVLLAPLYIQIHIYIKIHIHIGERQNCATLSLLGSSLSNATDWSCILSGKKNTIPFICMLSNFVDVKYSRNSKYCRSSLKKFWYMIWKQSKKPILHSPPIPTQFSNPHQFMPWTQQGWF